MNDFLNRLAAQAYKIDLRALPAAEQAEIRQLLAQAPQTLSPEAHARLDAQFQTALTEYLAERTRR